MCYTVILHYDRNKNIFPFEEISIFISSPPLIKTSDPFTKYHPPYYANNHDITEILLKVALNTINLNLIMLNFRCTEIIYNTLVQL
jgi:hypothetical protein